MQNNLGTTERKRVDNCFGAEGQQHPLLQVCKVIFTLRAGKLEGIKAEAEDIFFQVAWILDLIFSKSNIEALSQQEIDDLWKEQTQNMRKWPGSTVKDRELIVDTVFRIVRKLLCHHWDTYYSDCLYSLFCTTIEHESKSGDKEEQQRIQQRLSDFSEILNDWINNEYDGHLSEVIEDIIKGKTEKPKRKSGRKAKDQNSIVETFNYLPHLDDKGARLQAFYQGLRGRYIDMKTNQQDFIDLFVNKTTTKKVVWIQEINKLKYLITRIEHFVTCPQGFTKWQITCAHFQIRQKRRTTIDNKTDCTYIIEDLQTAQFSSSGKIPKRIDDLDIIIRILDPIINYKDALQEYIDAQLEHDEIKDKEDALANGLNTDIKA